MNSTSKLLSRQEIFDKAVSGLASQGFVRSRQSTDEQIINPKCLYRGPNNTKCAVGHLIPDDVFKDQFNTYDVRSLPSDVLLAAGLAIDNSDYGVEVPHIQFIASLQVQHDEAETPKAMKSNLRSFGIRYSLSIPEVLAK